MIESLIPTGSTVAGALLVLLVLAFLRFGDRLVDLLLAYRSSPVEAIEQSMSDRE